MGVLRSRIASLTGAMRPVLQRFLSEARQYRENFQEGSSEAESQALAPLVQVFPQLSSVLHSSLAIGCEATMTRTSSVKSSSSSSNSTGLSARAALPLAILISGIASVLHFLVLTGCVRFSFTVVRPLLAEAMRS